MAGRKKLDVIGSRIETIRSFHRNDALDRLIAQMSDEEIDEARRRILEGEDPADFLPAMLDAEDIHDDQ